MFEGLKALFKSKKFWLTVIGSAVVGGLKFAGVEDPLIMTIGSLFGLNIAAQGAADLKKK